MQKYYFKTDPRLRYVLFGLVEQRTVPGTKLLCSGFWGMARYDIVHLQDSYIRFLKALFVGLIITILQMCSRFETACGGFACSWCMWITSPCNLYYVGGLLSPYLP